MKRLMLLLAFATVLGLPALAQEDNVPVVVKGAGFDQYRAKSCTIGTLKGDYGILLHGTMLAHPVLPTGRFAALGIVTFDGEGNYTTQGVTNTNGLISTFGPNEAVPSESGTYTVNSDCTGLLTGGQLGFDYRIAIANDGQEYQVAFSRRAGTNVKAVVTGLAQRVGSKVTSDDPFERARTPVCTAGMVKGIYSLNYEGYINAFGPMLVGPFSTLGSLIADGESNLTVAFENSFSGVNVTGGQELTFTINANGFGRFSNGIYFVLVDMGKEMLVLGAYPEGINYQPGTGFVIFGRGMRM